MKTSYSFSVLRYIHDPVTQEFVNIGIAIFSPEARYFRALCTTSYGRITQVFQKIDGHAFRQLSRYIQEQICSAGRDYESSLPFDAVPTIEQLLARVLPADDSAIQFSKAGVGLSSDLDRTLHDLFQRYVEQYTASEEPPRKTDEDVWRVFREPLDRALVTSHLKPKRIVASNYEYKFERSWKNEIWHVYEPVSFDMAEDASLLDKANRWVGRAISLTDSPDPFGIHILLGSPSDDRLQPAFIRAQNILYRMPFRKEFVPESEAEAFANELKSEIQRHGWDEPEE